MTVAEAKMWGTTIGAVSWDDDRGYAAFEYAPTFLPSGRHRSRCRGRGDLLLPDWHGRRSTGCRGSLPTRSPTGSATRRLAGRTRPQAGRTTAPLTLAWEHLEFAPATGPDHQQSAIDVAALVALASEILTNRRQLGGSSEAPRRQQALQSILRVGTSAGGARAKAIIARNPATDEVRSGKISAGDGFSLAAEVRRRSRQPRPRARRSARLAHHTPTT